MQHRLFVLWLALASASAPAQDALRDGLAAYARADYSRALALLLPLARRGNAEAQYHLGNVYVLGQGAPAQGTDADREAARWYFEAAQQLHADAQYALGLLFLSGKGVVRDPDEALKWMRRAAAAGHADARRFVADLAPPGAR